MKTKPDSTVEKVKAFIRQPYAWPGGYPLYLVMSDGEPLCKTCAKSEFPLILSATKDNDKSGWKAEGVDVNWEDNELYCAHCGERIESAYGDDEEVDRDSAIAELSTLGIVANYCGMYSVYVDGMFQAFDDPVNALTAYRENDK